jgi:hypothetical protein
LWQKDERQWSLAEVKVGQRDRPSIYRYLLEHHSRDESDEPRLPDEPRNDQSQLRFAPGALDGLSSHGRFVKGSGSAGEHANRVASSIERLVRSPKPARDLPPLYALLLSTPALEYVDPLLKRLARSDSSRARLRELAVWLTTQAPDREAVKAGMALLGVFGEPDDFELLLTLGRHGEFTLFAAVGLKNLTPANYESHLWQLATTVHGWGRVQAVEMLSTTQRPDIRDWILREGFRNGVIGENLAFIAANTGNLAGALQSDKVDGQLLTSAGEIIEDLIHNGPAQGIDAYEHAGQAVEAYLKHLGDQDLDIQQMLTLQAISDYVTDPEAKWEERQTRGWTHQRRESVLEACTQLLSRQDWPQKIAVGLESSDLYVFGLAERAARRRGISTLEIHIQRLEQNPLDSGSWYHAMRQANETSIDRIVHLATTRLPLADIGTGPAKALGVGPEYGAHSCLDFVLQDVKRFPGRGWELIRTGLASPVVRNRNMAINALQAWPRDQWPADAAEVLNRSAGREPDDKVKARIIALIRGQPDPK